MGMKCVCGAPGMSCEYVQSAYPGGCPCEDVCMEMGEGEVAEDAVRKTCTRHREAVVTWYGDEDCPLCQRDRVTPKLVVEVTNAKAIDEAMLGGVGDEAEADG